MAPIAELSKSPVPPDAFEQFPGRWIAVRDGVVVADAATLDGLDANADVQATDVRFLVPESDSHFF